MHDLGYNGIPQPSPRPPKLFVWIVGVLSLIGIGMFVMFVNKYEPPLAPVAKFQEQNLVLSTVGNHMGQVVGVRCHLGDQACLYDVRFSVPASDEFSTVLMHEYELKDAYWKDRE